MRTHNALTSLPGVTGNLLAIGLFSAVINVLMLTGPLFMLQVYDRVLGSRSTSTLLVLFLVVAYLFVMMGLMDYVRGRALSRLGARLQDHFDRPALRIFLSHRDGSGALRDLGHVSQMLSGSGMGALFDLPWTPLTIAVLFVFHPWMGWFALGSVVLVCGLALANQAMTRRAQAQSGDAGYEADARASAMRQMQETLRGLGMTGAQTDLWKEARDKALVLGQQASARGGLMVAMTRALRLLLQSAMLALGAWLVLRGEVTAGAILAGSILLGRCLAPVEQTVGQWPALQRAVSGLIRLQGLMREAPPETPVLQLPRPTAALSVEDVSYIPSGEDRPILQGIRFATQPGDVVAVLGPSAAGKSTLARVLIGLLPPTTGQVRLGGASLDHYDADRLGLMMGYLPQEVQLFAGTIAQNIARFQPDARDADIVAAAQMAQAHELILSLPEGYQTRLTDGASRLSGGQRQRIGLARAFYGDPVVMLLDEPNSNLDETGITALNRAIGLAKAAGKTVFVMAHRPSSLAEANLVLMIDKGRMRAFGPRDEVLHKVMRNADKVVTSLQKKG